MGSLLNDIKNAVKQSGSNKGKMVYFKPGVKVRIRFLSNMEEGVKILFHDSFEKGINIPCQELYGRKCPLHEDEDLRHRDMFAWSVWDYEAKEVKILLAAVNNCSPIPALVGMYDTYGSMTDRDYIITKNGSQMNTTFSVVPMDKVKFNNAKAKPLSETKLLAVIDKAFPADSYEEDDEEDEDEVPVKKKPAKKAPAKRKPEPEPEEDEDDEDDEEVEYEEMSPKELYALCKERDLDPLPKKKAAYYIDLLEADDEEDDEDDEEVDEEDDW